jgi:hypothetical protein
MSAELIQPYVMSWQEYTLTMADLMRWPVAVVLIVLVLVIGAVRTQR